MKLITGYISIRFAFSLSSGVMQNAALHALRTENSLFVPCESELMTFLLQNFFANIALRENFARILKCKKSLSHGALIYILNHDKLSCLTHKL
ncbi:MAG: hypothetical protein D6732_24410 [Methanobacteriota archaeon]|nr:MAG: hypothetical protein D6732_24410 [Euryarchaeota archaeon]